MSRTVCRLCRAETELSIAEVSTLGWMVEREHDSSVAVFCDACVRTHLRAVEAKLDQRWW